MIKAFVNSFLIFKYTTKNRKLNSIYSQKNSRVSNKNKLTYIQALNKESEIINLTNDKGVKKKIFKQGSGDLVNEGMIVKINYEGKLENGQIFDSSIIRDEPYMFILGEDKVIKGWNIGIQSMKVGEIAEITIDPEYGYKKKGIPPIIPPNSRLIFNIELTNAEIDSNSRKKINFSNSKNLQANMNSNQKISKYDNFKPFIISPFGDLAKDRKNFLLNPFITFSIITILMFCLFFIVVKSGGIHS
ncbi:FK506-binding protein 5(PEPTIDYL-PROLYL CIS-TRANS ISOMERASE) (nucleomorph) [Guillardia theta]|uniref:peptidylprolyl isomerase n=1 Tax=Guillardia theta TaxID=55529 RepID=Q98S76_GUITH|nr:FK506-binding protein 5(PEPTIDYL-PROLYL CIS-TRANS ISOMERASE) [Guillardia theta]AAK39706.1 FK506-binding protein 5(PEPTIDYL-PROLYL CIS-TRANS ISOMERASE) [Guillardia theta]